MKIKVNEATNLQLDWMVAKCVNPNHGMVRSHQDNHDNWHITLHGECSNYAPTTDWAQGGPIIEREKISIRQWTNVPIVHAYMPDGEWSSDGQSPLIAAMRCYATSKLGDEVEVPGELV